MKERKVRDYLYEQVAARHGEVRPMRWINRAHAPDDFVALPGGFIALVEGKAPRKMPRPGQDREHARLRSVGVRIVVCDTFAQVDRLMRTYDTWT